MTQPVSKSAWRTWPALIVAGAALAGGYLLIITGPETAPEEKIRPPKMVTTTDVQPSDHRITVRAHGTVIPVREVTIEPQVTGPIIRHHPELVPGGFVEEGSELFAIDPSLMELTRRESKAAVSRAEAMLTESRRKQAEARRLSAEKVIADTDLAAVESEVQIQAAELERLGAVLDRTNELLDRHIVRAPFNSVVLEESVEIGQRVNPGFAAATLVGTDAFWVRAVIPVDRLRYIRLPKPGQAGAGADVYFDTGNGDHEHRRGRVVQLLTDMEDRGRMARVLVEIEDPLGAKRGDGPTPMLLGSYVRVEIDAGELENVLAIDRSSLREGDRIWVVDQNSELQIRDVVVRWQKDEIIYIENAVNRGEALIVSPLRVALPGMKVQARPSAPTPTVSLTQRKP